MFGIIYCLIKGTESFISLVFIAAIVIVFVNITGLVEKIPEPEETVKTEAVCEAENIQNIGITAEKGRE